MPSFHVLWGNITAADRLDFTAPGPETGVSRMRQGDRSVWHGQASWRWLWQRCLHVCFLPDLGASRPLRAPARDRDCLGLSHLLKRRRSQATVSSGMRTLPLVSELSITAVRKTARPTIVVTRIGPD